MQQTAEQAQIEGVPLSELEKRMMYFTESGYVPEDPIALNEEFEAECDTDEYEAKAQGKGKDARDGPRPLRRPQQDAAFGLGGKRGGEARGQIRCDKGFTFC